MATLIIVAPFLLLASGAVPRSSAAPTAEASAAELAGWWVARLEHAGEQSEVALHLEPSEKGRLLAKWSTPAIDLWEFPFARAQIHGVEVRLGPMLLTYDRAAGTLTGTVPDQLVPVYEMKAIFRRSEPLARPVRREPEARMAQPVWTFDAGAPLWADLAVIGDAVIAGADDGRLHALDARSGKERWVFRAGGAIRAAVAESGGVLYFQADDGGLYALDARSGALRWRVPLAEKPLPRLRLGDEKSRYENRSSAVAIAGGRLYLGTRDGHLLALDASGSRSWEFTAGDVVSSTPLLISDRVYFGSFDGNVYALDAATGALLWKHATGGAVTTGPARSGDLVIVGSRSYDLFAFAAKSGSVAWSAYYWFSWVESPATVFDGSVYTGSSDAAKLFAFDAATGRRLWAADAGGSAWGQPAVTDTRVFASVAGTLHYLIPHRGSALALDRATGRPVWRYPVSPPSGAPDSELTAYGFAGSPALSAGLVHFPGLDGRVYSFAQ